MQVHYMNDQNWTWYEENGWIEVEDIETIDMPLNEE